MKTIFTFLIFFSLISYSTAGIVPVPVEPEEDPNFKKFREHKGQSPLELFEKRNKELHKSKKSDCRNDGSCNRSYFQQGVRPLNNDYSYGDNFYNNNANKQNDFRSNFNINFRIN